MNTKTTKWTDLKDDLFGPEGNVKRDKLEEESRAFRIGEMLKDERKKANLTQAELAERSGTKKSYISRIERGLSDIQLSTYYRIVTKGLGKKLKIEIE
jgi:HTH-type transcriptional regulator / antitoxin HipB